MVIHETSTNKNIFCLLHSLYLDSIKSSNCAPFLTRTEMESNFFFALVSEAAGCALEVVQVVVFPVQV